MSINVNDSNKNKLKFGLQAFIYKNYKIKNDPHKCIAIRST